MSNVPTLINQKADQCVKCGLCLPHCPTYRLFEDENESPRGRIALIQALANQQIKPSDTLRRHLNHCLGCRNCERLCPSGVDYAFLLDHSRLMLNPKATIRGLGLTSNKTAQRVLQTLLYAYQRSGLQRLLRLSGILKLLHLQHLDALLPTIPPYQALKRDYPARGQSRGRLGLFTGCTGQLFDQVTLQKTIALLQHLGYEVVIPENQTCCGALHQHQGQIDSARALASRNLQAFEGLDTIIYIASGCGAQLHDYSKLFGADDSDYTRALTFTPTVKEVTTFLADEDLGSLHLTPLARRVAIHTPCSMRNALRGKDASHALLGHIPDLQIETIPAETGCCGAAGSYMITEASTAAAIRQTTLDAISQRKVDLVSTINIGCGLHLQAGLAGKTPYTHPVALFVGQVTGLKSV